MENKTNLTSVLDQLIEKHIAFACWFNPMDNLLGIVVGNSSDIKVLDRFDQLNGEAGFFLHRSGSPVSARLFS